MVQILGPIGVYQLARYITRKHPRVLMYHRFSDQRELGKVCIDTLERQIIELKDNFHVFPLSYISERLSNNKSIPENTVVITIDDGYKDFYLYAYPLLSKYNVPVTIYITTDFIDERIWLWPDKINYVLKGTNCDHVYIDRFNREISLATIDDRNSAWDELIGYCMGLPQEDRDKFIDDMADKLKVAISNKPHEEYSAMSWDMIREIAGNGIDIGAHTITHPVLSRESESKAIEEISGCKRKIESIINKPVVNFCYPNGQSIDYTDQVKEIVKNSGYENAVTAFYDKQGWEDNYEIRRHGVGDDIFHFKNVIYGLEYIGLWL